MSRFRVLALAVLLLLPVPAHAQRPDTGLTSGARIRIRVPGSAPLVGTVTSGGMNSLTLVSTSGDTVVVPREAIADIQVSRGRHSNRWKGAKYGAIVGGTVGLVVAALEDRACRSCEMDFGPAIYPIGALLFGTLGGGVGLVVGSFSQSERWTRVQANVGVTVGPDAGTDRFRVGVVARF